MSLRTRSMSVTIVSLFGTLVCAAFAKDTFPKEYVPTVFENYVADIKVDGYDVELSLWDTAGQVRSNRSGMASRCFVFVGCLWFDVFFSFPFFLIFLCVFRLVYRRLFSPSWERAAASCLLARVKRPKVRIMHTNMPQPTTADHTTTARTRCRRTTIASGRFPTRTPKSSSSVRCAASGPGASFS